MFLAACQPSPARLHLTSDEKLRITRSVWDDFQTYKRNLGGGGAFVVTENGLGSGYSYCPDVRCRPGSFTEHAIRLCESAGVKCVVFAQGTTILIDYEIVD